jgi:hypothetical protein
MKARMFSLWCVFVICSFSSVAGNDEHYQPISEIVALVKTSDYRECEAMRMELQAMVSALESQLAYAELRYEWHTQGVRDTDSIWLENDEHGQNAVKLELMKVLLNHKLDEMILRERIKQINKMQSKVRAVNPMPRFSVCADFGTFLERLADAKKVEFRYAGYSDSFEFASLVVSEKDKILLLRDLFESLNLDCDPVLRYNLVNDVVFMPSMVVPVITTKRFDISSVSQVIINDSLVVKICGRNTILCLGAAYHCRDEGVDLARDIKAVLGRKGEERGQSAPYGNSSVADLPENKERDE